MKVRQVSLKMESLQSRYTTRVTEGFLTISILNIQISILLLGREIRY